ncbi:MAG: restriction endonuclease subunit S, partial [Candidatus Falkowbacteria bacterium]|nr:restriction endonuclease subunit S [Candidatus Falkowbacteria bacterium]
MLTYNINKQQLGSLSRLDPEYSRPEFLNLKLGECFLLGDLVEIKIGATLKKINESGDTYYIRTGDFKDAGIDFKNCLKGTFSQTRKVEQLRVDDILITRKGSVGRIEMVNDDFPEKTFISSEI